MRRAVPVLILILATVSGCIPFSKTKLASMDEIDKMVETRQYGRALAAAKERRNSSPSKGIDNTIARINELADQYDMDESTRIYTLINDQNISQAKQELAIALQNYPEGKRLNKINYHLQKTESTQISRLQAQQLLAKADWLLRAKDIQKSLSTIKPEGNETFSDPSADIEETAAELYHLGLKAMQKGDLELADSCLTMSNRLHTLPFTTSALARLETLRKQQQQQDQIKQKQIDDNKRVVEIRKQQKTLKQNRKQQEQQLAKRKLEFESIYYNTMTMLKDNQLSSVKSNLDKLNSLLPDDERLVQLNAEFKKKLPDHVNALVERGRELYINGKIEQARNIWLKAQSLDPDNEEIEKNIERANRVLGRLHELKKKKKQ